MVVFLQLPASCVPQLDSSVSNLPKKTRPGEVQQRRKGNPKDLEPRKNATIFQLWQVSQLETLRFSRWKKIAGPKIVSLFGGGFFGCSKFQDPTGGFKHDAMDGVSGESKKP